MTAFFSLSPPAGRSGDDLIAENYFFNGKKEEQNKKTLTLITRLILGTGGGCYTYHANRGSAQSRMGATLVEKHLCSPAFIIH